MKIPARFATAALIGSFLPAPASAVDFTRYHTHQELSAALQAAVAAHPDLARLVSLGKTHEGRDLWAVELAKRTGTPVEERPALLVVGNLEGDHLIGSELALYLVDHLLNGYAKDAAIQDRLDHQAIYVIPRVNPDGAEQMFAKVQTGLRTNLVPTDADNDGRMNEDGPLDLNQDGFITVMRVKDPKGPYMIHPEDPRLMKRADPAKGERGGYSIYWEGKDQDQDGFIAEDGPGGVDINRNFMHKYPYFEPDAGPHMASEVETRALLEFVLQHPNVAAILSFGESDNLIVPPTRAGLLAPANPINLLDFAERSTAGARKTGLFQDLPQGFGRGGRGMGMGGEGGPPQPPAPLTGRAALPDRVPVTTVNGADYEYFKTISDKYRELTGLRGTGFTRTPAGAFFEYGYYQYGVPSFSTPGWGLPPAPRPAAPEGAPRAVGTPAAPAAGRTRGGAPAPQAAEAPGGEAEGIDLRLLQWIDAEKIDGFVPWKPFQHPDLGEVEIGGFKPYATTNPPASKIAELGASHARFALYLSSLFSRIHVAKSEVQSLGGGLYRIKAEVENTGFLPTALAHAVVAHAVKPVMVQLMVPPESIVTGSEKTNHIQALAGSNSRQAFEWIIKGKPGSTVALRVVSYKSGRDTATLKLQ